jgi:soluble lytic murein transglycosylase
MRQESAFDPAAVSSAGAIGLMQLMPETAKDEASRLGLEKADPWEPRMNILLGTAHLARALQTFGTVEEALAAYNAGSGSVRKWGNRTGAIEEWVEEIPFPETNEYVRKVLGNYSIYKAFETRNSGGGQGGKEVRK